jgi:hypothetical protein
MQISGKNVQNTWKKNVQKTLVLSFTQNLEKSTKVLQKFIDKFYTINLFISYLLKISFTPFPHRTTITTTIFNNKEGNF